MNADPADPRDDASAQAGFSAARDALVPAVGERMADLIAREILLSVDRPDAAGLVEERLRANGDDPEAAPRVTETEAALLAWARHPDAGALDDGLGGVASPSLRRALGGLADAARAL